MLSAGGIRVFLDIQAADWLNRYILSCTEPYLFNACPIRKLSRKDLFLARLFVPDTNHVFRKFVFSRGVLKSLDGVVCGVSNIRGSWHRPHINIDRAQKHRHEQLKNMNKTRHTRPQCVSLSALIKNLRKQDEVDKIQKKSQQKKTNRPKLYHRIPRKVTGPLRDTLKTRAFREEDRVNIVVFYEPYADYDVCLAVGAEAECTGILAMGGYSRSYICSAHSAINVARVPGVIRVARNSSGFEAHLGL